MPVYYEFRKAGDELLVTYWFSYGHSAPHTGEPGAALGDKLSHEGDWENVALALDGSAPRAVYFYGHGAPTRRTWEQLELNGDHPVVYSALDSHASYSRAALPRSAATSASNDIRDQGFRWDTWKGADSLRPARDEPWFGYGGAWGAAKAAQGQTGPLGPSIVEAPARIEPTELAPGSH